MLFGQQMMVEKVKISTSISTCLRFEIILMKALHKYLYNTTW